MDSNQISSEVPVTNKLTQYYTNPYYSVHPNHIHICGAGVGTPDNVR